MRSPLNVAHRGFALAHPENTIPAFRAAVDAGAEMIELDVHETRDGEFIVVHDDRLRPGAPAWSELTWHESRALLGGEDLAPRLGDVIDALPATPVDIEVKTCRDATRLRAFLDELPAAPGTFVSSSRHALLRTLAVARIARPLVLVVGLTRRGRVGGNARSAALCTALLRPPRWLAGLAVDHRLVSPRLVRRLHAGRRVIYPWTVDDPERMRRLASWGVDGIITNRPDWLRATLG